MNEEEVPSLTTDDIDVLKMASIDLLLKLNLDQEAITNIWGSITAEHERLSETDDQKEAAYDDQ